MLVVYLLTVHNKEEHNYIMLVVYLLTVHNKEGA